MKHGGYVIKRKMGVRLIVGSLFAAMTVVGVSPAFAAGKTGTFNGCYAQWWDTAGAGYCYSSSRSAKQLRVLCNNQGDYTGGWVVIEGTAAPFDRHECRYSVQSAYVNQSTG
ncbi:hypothetical protein [Plantactinospora sp. KLBMP9567]|uniref:hypothetical protein n=1 Tax=Plantactinospora sp. KLBMP9567 TaxID=3085900 RepID=UPI002980A4D9|nr:hypothetical protein [Plantactinospora sp. KLBMP9567]MDW5327627.1 hypothetical protein [Plantactinospora sp. KLBMP9567]